MNGFVTSRYEEKLNIEITIPTIKTDVKLPVVIMTHGFGSNGMNATNTKLSKMLNEQNIATVILDLSGHGLSEGKIEKQTITKAQNEIEDVLETVRNYEWVDKSKIVLVGSSFSGNSILLLASKTDEICAVALKSPITNYKDVIDRKLDKNIIKKWQRDGYSIWDGEKINYEFYRDICTLDTYSSIINIKYPIFIVQGNNDELISEQNIEELKNSLDKKKDKLIIIQGANHRYTKQEHFNKCIMEMYNFIIKILK